MEIHWLLLQSNGLRYRVRGVGRLYLDEPIDARKTIPHIAIA